MTPEEKLLALIQKDKREADNAAKTPVLATAPVEQPTPNPFLLRQDATAGQAKEGSRGGEAENVAVPVEKKLKLVEPKAEVRGQRTEDRGQRSEVREPKSEVREPRAEVPVVATAASVVPDTPTLSPSHALIPFPRFRSSGGSGILLLNRVLGVVVLVLVVVVFYSMASMRPGIAEALERQVSGAGSMSVAPPVVLSDAGLGVDAYLNKVGARNIFVPKVAEKAGVITKVEHEGAPKDLKLVAISMDASSPAESMAIIKIKSDSKTYFVKQGQTVGDTGYLLDRVLFDRIVLKQRNQEYELK